MMVKKEVNTQEIKKVKKVRCRTKAQNMRHAGKCRQRQFWKIAVCDGGGGGSGVQIHKYEVQAIC